MIRKTKSSKPARSWNITEARANIAKVLKLAHRDGPQIITQRGEAVAVLVSPGEWQRKSSTRIKS
jgi:prevent-host-death family protein